MKTRQEIKALAKEAFAAQRGTAILLELAFFGVAIAAGLVIGIIFGITGSWMVYAILFTAFILGVIVLAVNAMKEHIKVYRRETASVGAMFADLKVNFWRKLGGLLWMELWVMLWSLLLVIPGIVKGLAYSMTPFILADHPEVEARQALKISMKITNGHKLDIFVFGLTFIGWFILSGLTLGILYFVYVGPYFYTSYAGLYQELRDKALRDGKVTHQELGMEPPHTVHDPMIIN